MSETYTRINWKDGENGGTPISADNLNLMDLGIEKAHQLIEELKKNGVGGVTEEQLKNAVDAYFIKNPIQTVSDIFMRVSDGYIQFSTDNLTWKNVIAVSELKGQTGKTAYQYAQDGGYTGTEEEFAKKLAQENPTREEFSRLSKTIADKATVENGIVKVWKSATEEGGSDTLLYTIDLSTLNTGGGGGWSNTAESLLITVLRACATKTDQTANITALETALASSGGGSSGGVTTYSVINSLTNITNDNSTTVIVAGQGYTATLTPSEGYALDSVKVTMGGVDVTSDVYTDGVIVISSVTGDILITATAEESATAITSWLYHFDNNLYPAGEKDFGFQVKNGTYDSAPMSYIDGKFGKTFRGYCNSANASNDRHYLYATDLNEYPILDGDFTIAFWARNTRNATKATYLSTITSNAWAYGAQTPTPNLVDTENWTLNTNNGRKPYGFWIDWVTGLRVHMVDSTDTYGMCFVVTPTDASLWDTETWHHYAVTRKDGVIMLFVDGKMIWNVEFDGEIAFGNRIGVGCIWNASGTLISGEPCDLDELLIDDETCRYAENFEIPTSPYKG